MASAVDIYPNSGLYEEQVFSPVNGKIVMVREVHPPEPRSFKASVSDWLLLIKSEDEPYLGIRILHVKPKVKTGDRVEIGDSLGCHIRSGYFNFWTGPHIHVEIRNLENPLRAKGGYPLTPINNTSAMDSTSYSNPDNLNLKVTLLNDEFLTVEPKGLIARIGCFWGFACKVGDQIGVLDGGLPHYGRCGVHLNSTDQIERDNPVKIGNLIVGRVTEKSENYLIFKCSPIKTHVNALMLRGLSLYLHLRKPSGVKVVPYTPKYLRFLRRRDREMTVELH